MKKKKMESDVSFIYSIFKDCLKKAPKIYKNEIIKEKYFTSFKNIAQVYYNASKGDINSINIIRAIEKIFIANTPKEIEKALEEIKSYKIKTYKRTFRVNFCDFARAIFTLIALNPKILEIYKETFLVKNINLEKLFIPLTKFNFRTLDIYISEGYIPSELYKAYLLINPVFKVYSQYFKPIIYYLDKPRKTDSKYIIYFKHLDDKLLNLLLFSDRTSNYYSNKGKIDYRVKYLSRFRSYHDVKRYSPLARFKIVQILPEPLKVLIKFDNFKLLEGYRLNINLKNKSSREILDLIKNNKNTVTTSNCINFIKTIIENSNIKELRRFNLEFLVYSYIIIYKNSKELKDKLNFSIKVSNLSDFNIFEAINLVFSELIEIVDPKEVEREDIIKIPIKGNKVIVLREDFCEKLFLGIIEANKKYLALEGSNNLFNIYSYILVIAPVYKEYTNIYYIRKEVKTSIAYIIKLLLEDSNFSEFRSNN